MADLGALVTIADKVFQLLQSPVLRDMKKWESDLENLNNSVSFIKNMLLDADRKPELSHGEQGWVSVLNEVLYDADDLFDEVITIAKQKKLNAGAKFSKNVLDKVFLSHVGYNSAWKRISSDSPPKQDNSAFVRSTILRWQTRCPVSLLWLCYPAIIQLSIECRKKLASRWLGTRLSQTNFVSVQSLRKMNLIFFMLFTNWARLISSEMASSLNATCKVFRGGRP